ncbi:MAG: Acg family FMN-binding oxidoreductase [Phycisphaerales bacterium JB037]
MFRRKKKSELDLLPLHQPAHERVSVEGMEAQRDRLARLRRLRARKWYQRVHLPVPHLGLLAKVRGGRGEGVRSAAEAPVEDPKDPWFINERAFPASREVQAKLQFCLKYAVLAPSSHNSQPWRFRVGVRHADVIADRSRGLPVVDPEDRELTISCGAALYHLELAAHVHGMRTETELLPSAADGDLLARVKVVGDSEPTPEHGSMLKAVVRRHTHRGAFEDRQPPVALLERCRSLAAGFGVGFRVLEGRDRIVLSELIAEADLMQLGDRRFRRELASWMHHNRSHSKDGLPGFALGMSEVESVAVPWIVRTFDVGDGRAAKDEELAQHSPVLAVFDTPGDEVGDWVNAGRALAAVLLKATAAGMAASYLNQPIEVGELRPRVGKLVHGMGRPQLVVRMGYAQGMRHTPRRPVDEVYEWSPVDIAEEDDLAGG